MRTWLECDSERCSFCEQLDVWQLGAFCLHCDRPICPFCMVVLETARWVACPECQAPAHEGRRRPGAGDAAAPRG